ncbi:MAG: elongation factor 4 [Candidatus Liptonbacteria bacterium]|nr:elongation factor 4 [Candidatus Liptonbacteria bacterium]
MDNHIRNFVIIAHIDSGKSTLADRLLETTGTITAREMQPQYLDQLELERERGITIKMAPVRMQYEHKNKDDNTHTHAQLNSKYTLNLIDTPGHSDFSYEVSRALAAVEGAILLVDGTKGIQAQTLANLRAARRANLKIIGAVNKIDVQGAGIEEIVASVGALLDTPKENILRVSAKTGAGVEAILEKVVKQVPPPKPLHAAPNISRALIFDSLYDDHKGIVAYVRLTEGELKAGDEIHFAATGAKIRIKEVGYFAPRFAPAGILKEGEIGYIATGQKDPSKVKIGDTIVGIPVNASASNVKDYVLEGYREPQPVVFLSFYPDGETQFEDLERALSRLKLTDPALSFEPDSNEALGRGFKVGFLGQLHFEIASSRLEREFNLSFLTSFPSVAYRIEEKGKTWRVTQAQDFPPNPDKVWEPIIELEIVVPPSYLNQVLTMQQSFELSVEEIKNFGAHLALRARMPLRELIRDFDDRLKSASAGFASFSYEIVDEAAADVTKVEILLAGEGVPALTRIVPTGSMEREARLMVERLKEILPKQQFAQAIQAQAGGRIIARETIPAMKKLLGNFGKTGGDRTRKMKLWKKQKEGKKKLESMARVKLAPEVFREILKK